MRLLPFIVAIPLVVMAGVNGGAFLIMDSQRNDVLFRVGADNDNLVKMLARQTDRLFQSLDIVERNVVENLDALNVRTAGDLRSAGPTNTVFDMLVKEKNSLSPITWLSLIDDRGDLIATSMIAPTPQANLRDRDYFAVLSQPGGPRSFVSKPVPNWVTRMPTMFVGLRMTDAAGKFLGIIIAGVETSYFQAIFDSLTVREGSEIFLLRDDGVILSSRSPPGSQAAKAFSPGSAADPGDEDVMQVQAPLESYPVRVLIRQRVSVALGEWRNEATLVTAVIIALDLSAIVAGVLGFRYVRQTRRFARIEFHSARHDLLTKLPNRTSFQEKLADLLRSGAGVGCRFGLLLLDLDKFKEVNDGAGHKAGDELLAIVARRLEACIGPDDLLARLGGDEFAIIAPGAYTKPALSSLGDRAISQFDAPFVVSGRSFKIGVSIGAVLGSDGDDPQRLFDQSDMALYQAKESGRGTMHFFSVELSLARQERNALAADVVEAVRREAFEIYFQPVVNLSTDRLIGFEALLRWNDPVRGKVPPSTFIPVAEATGSIGPLGTWVLREACRQAATWPNHLCVAVNLSPIQFQCGDVARDVEDALLRAGLPARRLEVEITESVLLDQPSAQSTLRSLAAKAVSVSLDDFGTGYSSLSYLRSFPFHRIKVDKSFVQEMIENREAGVIVRTVMDLAGRLGMAVTAEGIETHAQLRMLTSIGCDAGQGYLFSRPLPASEVLDFITTHEGARKGAKHLHAIGASYRD